MRGGWLKSVIDEIMKKCYNSNGLSPIHTNTGTRQSKSHVKAVRLCTDLSCHTGVQTAPLGLGKLSALLLVMSFFLSGFSWYSPFYAKFPWDFSLPLPPPPEPPEALLPAAPEDTGLNKFGIYLNAGTTADEGLFAGVIQNMQDKGVTALVFDVKGSFVYFDTDAELANELNMVRPLYDLPAIVQQAEDAGIYTIARFVALKDPVLGEVVPDLRLKHPTAGYRLESEWIEPAHETVLQYNREILKRVAESGVDEINLDYIRYPSDNLTAMSHLSVEERVSRVEGFVRMAHEVIDDVGMGTQLGISTYAILGWHFEQNVQTIAQDVTRLAPYVDVISPMAYPSTFAYGYYFNPELNPRNRNYYLVLRTLEGYKEVLGEEHAYKLRPWIQAYYMNATGIRDQIDAVIDAGSCGFTMWSATNYYQEFYKAVSNWELPLHCEHLSTELSR